MLSSFLSIVFYAERNVCVLFLYIIYSSEIFFFFSSRRRHTRCLSDWSSDVCSSDLPAGDPHDGAPRRRRLRRQRPQDLDHQQPLRQLPGAAGQDRPKRGAAPQWHERAARDRKSTRLNSSHLGISYAVFCLKKKKRR